MKNILDLILIAAGVLGFMQGYRKGLLGAVTSLGAFSLASMLTIRFSPLLTHIVGGMLEEQNSNTYGIMHIVVSTLTFIVSKQLIIYITKIITSTLEAVKLGFLNRLLGAGFGFLKVVFFCVIIVLFLDKINPFLENLGTNIPNEVFEKSNLYTPMREGLYRFVNVLWNSFFNSSAVAKSNSVFYD